MKKISGFKIINYDDLISNLFQDVPETLDTRLTKEAIKRLILKDIEKKFIKFERLVFEYCMRIS